MKKRKVTYGVHNLVEWLAVLKMGKARIKVLFSGGAITTQGVTPATFTTSDPMVQLAVEGSPEFKRGKIKIIRRYDLKGDVAIERNPCKALNGDQCDGRTAGADTQHQDMEKDGDGVSDMRHDGGVEPEKPQQDVGMPAPLTSVEFSCNDDAKDYLEKKFGVIRSKLHNRADIVGAGLANGVEIVFV